MVSITFPEVEPSCAGFAQRAEPFQYPFSHIKIRQNTFRNIFAKVLDTPSLTGPVVYSLKTVQLVHGLISWKILLADNQT